MTPVCTNFTRCYGLPATASFHVRHTAPRLKRLHGNPIVWWMGQVIKYATRQQPNLTATIEAKKLELGFRSPIVG